MFLIEAARDRLTHLFSDRGPKLFRDLLSLVSGQSASMVIGFLTFAYLARTLDTVAYGALEFTISTAGFAAMVIECGVGAIGVRELSRSPGRAAELAAQIPAARMLLAILVIPIVGIIGLLSQQSAEVTALIWIYAFSLVGMTLKQDWLLQATERMTLAALAQPIRTAVFAAGVFLFVGQGTGLIAIGWIELVSVLAVSAYFLSVQYARITPFGFGWRFREIVFLLKEGLSVGLSNILWAFMLFAPMFLLVGVHPDGSEPAWLGASLRIVVSLLTMSFIYHFNLYPVMVRTLERDQDAWFRVIQSSMHLVAWGGIAVALILTLFSRDLMTLVFGADFAGGAPVLAVLAWIFPVRLQTGHARWSLVAKGAQKYLLLAEIVGSTTLVVVGLAIIPSLGAVGAALAFAAGIIASGVVTQIAVNRVIGRVALLAPSALPVGAALAALALCSIFATDRIAELLIAGGVFLFAGLLRIRPLMKDLHRIAYAKAHQSDQAGI